MSEPTFVAIIPAAGLSRRMGQPKLLLPWRGTTVIANLIDELHVAGIQTVFVVVRKSDRDLQTAVTTAGGIGILPDSDPPDMRSSVEHGLRAAFEQQECLTGTRTFDGWLLIPADHPIISQSTLQALARAWLPDERQVLIPAFDGKRGHPTLFSADFAAEVEQIPPDQGLNWLVRQQASFIREVPVTDPGVTMDLDTPEDYQRLLRDANKLP